MPLTALTLPHLPTDLRIHIAFYTSLQNASFLRSQLLAGNTDFEYAFVDASTILTPSHILSAIFRAVNDHLHHRLRTRNIHSEIVYCLGHTNNITTTLNTFGITPDTENLLVVKVACPSLGLNEDVTEESVRDHLGKVVEGKSVEFGDEGLRGVTDVERVKKVYKLGGGGGGGGSGGSKEKGRRRKDGTLEGGRDGSDRDGGGKEGEREDADRKELEMQVLGLMALRGAV